ncbi:MAG: hypothetical protein K6G08_02345 [Prevotella sp.]|nr:hypothetical protein [Prevotella sp.]
MNYTTKKTLIGIAIVTALALVGVVVWLMLDRQRMADENTKLALQNNDMKQVAEQSKQDMLDDYAQTDLQYGELMKQISNDSLIAQLTREQLRARQLEEELKKVSSDNAAEISRLRRELKTVREVLKTYIRQVDSLNQVNQSLRNENFRLTGELEETSRQNQNLQEQTRTQAEQLNIAAQLRVSGISMIAENKRGRQTEKIKKCENLRVSFTLLPNVTAQSGMRTIYVRIQTPTGAILTAGTFNYENRQLEYSMKKTVEYGGEETPVTTYWKVNETLLDGQYLVSIFDENNLLDSRTFTFK